MTHEHLYLEERFDTLECLKMAGLTTVAQWLAETPGTKEIQITEARNGQKVLVVKEQSQDSRIDPFREANRWLETELKKLNPETDLWLFGLGSPLTLLSLVDRGFRVNVYEPDPRVVLAAISYFAILEHIQSGQVHLISPWELAADLLTPPDAPPLLIHPPSRRRNNAQALNFQKFTAGDRKKYLAPATNPSIMIIPPLSGGSLSMGPALYRAGLALGLETHLLDWDQSLINEVQNLQSTPKYHQENKLFPQTTQQAAAEATQLLPNLIICLAQAPLDAQGIMAIKEATHNEPLFAFWFVEDFLRFKYVSEVAPAYDLFFHIQGNLMDATLKNWGLSRTWYLPPAAEPAFFSPETIPNQYKVPLSFMGAGYPNRRHILKNLSKNYWLKTGRPMGDFKIFGSGWEGEEKELGGHLFEGGRRLSAEESAFVYAGTQINLNIHSGAEQGFSPESAFVNPRTFELAAAGALQLVDNRPLLRDLFSEKEVVIINSPEELPDKIEYYLAHPEEARAIGLAARKKVIEKHTYEHRLEFMIRCARGL